MRTLLSTLLACLAFVCSAFAQGESVYTERFADPNALFFTPEAFGFEAGTKADVSDALQEAINRVKQEKNFGTLYIPEGKYYTIPYRTLIPKGADNMLVAGRCISSDHGAQAS